RAFDTIRAFLPAGAATNLVWVGELRQLADRLLTLRHHPLAEVRNVAEAILAALLKEHPTSFTEKTYLETEAYARLCQELYAYFDDPEPAEFELSHNALRPERLAEYRSALSERPAKTELPFNVRECGTLEFRYLLDFGSF